MVEARCARSSARSERSSRRTLRVRRQVAASHRAAGSARRNSTTVLRPLNTTLRSLRKRPTETQSSVNSSRHRLLFLLRRAAPEDRDRNEIDVEVRIGGRRGDQLHQVARAPAGGCARIARENRRRGAPAPKQPLRARQAQLSARVVEYREIRMALALEHVAHRPRARGESRRDVVGLDGDLDPQSQNLADAPTPGPDQAAERAHGGAARSTGRVVAALLRVDRLARGVGVLIDGVLHAARAVELLRQRIEYGLRGRRRRIGRLLRTNILE